MTKNPATDFQKKLKITSDLFALAYQIKFSSLKRQHPEWSEKEIHQATLALLEKGTR